MKTMRNWCLLFLIVLSLICFSGCFKKNNNQQNTTKDSVTGSVYSNQYSSSTTPITVVDFSDEGIKTRIQTLLPVGFVSLQISHQDIDNDSFPEVAAAYQIPGQEASLKAEIAVFKWDSKLGQFQAVYSKALESAPKGVEKIKIAEMYTAGKKNIIFIYSAGEKGKGILIIGYDNKSFYPVYTSTFADDIDIDDSDSDGISEIELIHSYTEHVQKPIISRYFQWDKKSFVEFNKKISYNASSGKKQEFAYPRSPQLVVLNYIQSYLIGLKDELEKLCFTDKARSFNISSHFSNNAQGGLNYFSAVVISSHSGQVEIRAFGKETGSKGVVFKLIKKDGKWKITEIM